MPSLVPNDRPIARRRLPEWIDPAELASALREETGAEQPAAVFWLDSGNDAAQGMSYLGSTDTVVTASASGEIRWEPSGLVERLPALEVLRRQTTDEGAPLLGWVGWLGYGLAAQTMDLEVSAGGRHPDSVLLGVDRLIAVDHGAGTAELVAVADGASEAWFERMLTRLARPTVPAPPDGPLPSESTAPRWNDSDADYLAAIEECLRAITEGEAYQLCLTTEVVVDGDFDPHRVWNRLRMRSPTHHGGIIELGATPSRGRIALVSASPESFLEVEPSGFVSSSPIKGTRARSADPVADAALAEELRLSEKEQAENLMIVDLMRNDLGRVCAAGSVTVPVLFEVQSYAQVHQLVSRVNGRLAGGRHPVDAIGACFPAGSMTGAPKRRAMELLERIESRPRGVYAGAFGYVGVDGSVDLGMVIRTIMLDATSATIGSGGGITALSVPAEELAEMKLKAAALLAVLKSA